MSEKSGIAYAQESHRAFNERLERVNAPKPRNIAGPWLSNEAVTKLPRLRRDFEGPQSSTYQTGRDRSEGQTARGSVMVKQDRPHPAPRPAGPLGEAVDRQAFKERWLVEQRDAALAQAAARQRISEPARDISRVSQEPSR